MLGMVLVDLRMLIGSLVGLVVLALRTRASMHLEIVALRHQLTVYPRPERPNPVWALQTASSGPGFPESRLDGKRR